jgi:Zn-dependent peptidase ImmA (M78 family)
MVSSPAWRTAELRGAAAARAVQDRLGLRDALADGEAPLDVFEAIYRLELPCLLKPLDSLLGAYIRHGDLKGIIVTTRRDLHLQRFTAAHELGHSELNHAMTSLDKESDIGFVARGPMPEKASENYPVQEIEADAFASEFLLPKWLIAAHCRKQRWTIGDLSTSDVVYQLSLRLATSYSATCWSLVSNSLITTGKAVQLLKVAPKTTKQRALPGKHPDSWRDVDVWLLTERDAGSRILGDPKDRLVMSLTEHASSGYRWHVSQPKDSSFSIELDDRLVTDGEAVGAPITRRLVMSGEGAGSINLREERPWMSDDGNVRELSFRVQMLGPEPVGLPRVARRAYV